MSRGKFIATSLAATTSEAAIARRSGEHPRVEFWLVGCRGGDFLRFRLNFMQIRVALYRNEHRYVSTHVNISTRINPPAWRLKYQKNNKDITVPISIASGHSVDMLHLFLAVCTLWAVFRKVANLSIGKASYICFVHYLLLEGCSFHRLIEGGLEIPFVLVV
jgi:hypothetical protein